MSRDETTLLDIARAAHLVIEFKQGMDKESFVRDIKTQVLSHFEWVIFQSPLPLWERVRVRGN